MGEEGQNAAARPAGATPGSSFTQTNGMRGRLPRWGISTTPLLNRRQRYDAVAFFTAFRASPMRCVSLIVCDVAAMRANELLSDVTGLSTDDIERRPQFDGLPNCYASRASRWSATQPGIGHRLTAWCGAANANQTILMIDGVRVAR